MRIPERWRWAHHVRASLGGYFWARCPLCWQYFGGHEWRNIDGKPSAIYRNPSDPSLGEGICPQCTREGRGEHPLLRGPDGRYVDDDRDPAHG